MQDIIQIESPRNYKLHLACEDTDGTKPLDVFVRSPEEWLAWNEYRGRRNDWTRDYILALIEFYHRTDEWLFGGIFKVTERLRDKYRLQQRPESVKYVGRLIVGFHRYQGMRGRAFYLEKYIDKFEVKEVLPNAYDGEAFCGPAKIDHDFNVLEPIFRNGKVDWKSALEGINGVYVIFDKETGKKYVGSAYGEGGIWSRWLCYIETGHGGNDELTKLIKQKGVDYARKNFKFSLLERMDVTIPKDEILARESYWKGVLLAVGEFGYNEN
jgi:hypothetical protein